MAVVPIISQSWDTTSYVNPTRMNNIETNISTLSKATGIEYSSGVSVKDKIDENAGKIYLLTFIAIGTEVSFSNSRTDILTINNVSLKKGIYAAITSINATWTSGSYQTRLGVKVGDALVQGYEAAAPQTNGMCQIVSKLEVPSDGTYNISIWGQTTNSSKVVTIPTFQSPYLLLIKE